MADSNGYSLPHSAFRKTLALDARTTRTDIAEIRRLSPALPPRDFQSITGSRMDRKIARFVTRAGGEGGAGGMSLRLPGLYRASSTGGPLNNNALKEHTQASRQSARVAGSKRRKTAAFRSADRTYYRRPRDVPVHVINCCGKYVPCTSGEFAPLERTMANDK
jgi:hypothetical protein